MPNNSGAPLRRGMFIGILAVSAAALACDDGAVLTVPQPTPQSATVAPLCFGRPAGIHAGNPGSAMVDNGDGTFTITGTAGNDVIVAGPGDDVIDGAGGTDRICAGDGNDQITGGADPDFLDGEAGTDVLLYTASPAGVTVNLETGRARGGDADRDRIQNIENVTGSAFADNMRGDSLANELQGGGGEDVLRGGAGDDVLRGGVDRDFLDGEAGADALFGDGGPDVLVGGSGADALDGGTESDVANYVSSPARVEVDLSAAGIGGAAEGDTYTGIEDIIGSAFPDLLIGDAQINDIDGRGGDDAIHGGEQNDRLSGGLGADTIHGGAGDDLVLGGAGNDEVHGDAGADQLFGHADDDIINGGDDDDDLRPGAGLNTVDGGSGNDHIDTTSCTDIISNVETFKTVRCGAATSTANSTLSAASASLVADGADATTITLQLRDGDGNSLTLGSSAVVMTTTAGSLSDGVTQAASLTAVSANDGTYSLTLNASAVLETATISATVDGNPIATTLDVPFMGVLDHFAVTFTDDGVIPSQENGTEFTVKVVALDVAENPASYNGTVDLTYEGAGNGAIGVSGNFVAGVLNPQPVTVPVDGSVSIRATRTGGTETGASTAFTVASPFIVLAPDSAFVLAGETVPLTAVVKNFDGTDAADQSVVWTSSDDAHGTVDAAGLVTGIMAGNISITATQGALSSSAALGVCPNLAVGSVYADTFPSASNICFGGGASGQEYTYVPVNASEVNALSLSVTGVGIQAVTGPPSPDVVPEFANALGIQHQLAAETLHMQMLAANASVRMNGWKPVTPSNRNLSIAFGNANASVQMNPTWSTTPLVGDVWDINVNPVCFGVPDTRTGRVVSISAHAIIVSDSVNPPGGFTTAQYDSIGLEFDSIAYPAVTENFGAPADIDGNGKIVLFFTRAVNELSPPASSSVTPAYHSRNDLFDVGSCTGSNEGELLYMMTPDPTGVVNSNVRTVSLVRGQTIRSAGHELQHLTNASRRMYVTASAEFEEAWLDEQLSAVAEELMFYRTSVGLAPRGNIQLSTLTTGPNASRRVAAFNTYANNNFGRMRSWLQRPDTLGPFKNPPGLAVQGAGWGFLRYAADRVNGTEADFWSSLVDSQLEGLANIQNAIGGADPHDWLRDFIAAMYADDAVGAAVEHTQPSWNFRSVYGGLGGFPLLARPLADNVFLTLSYSRGGGSSYLRFGVPASGFATLSALSGGTIPTSPYRLVVMRTK